MAGRGAGVFGSRETFLKKEVTGVVAAAYRMEVDGWSEAEAEAEMEAFGFHEFWSQFKEFVRRYPEDRKGIQGGNSP
jgi:hypothetical protein